MATFQNTYVKNVDTAQLTAITSISDSTIVLSILCANTDGTSTVDFTAQRKDSGSEDKGYLAFTIPVPGDANFEVLSNKYILPSGDRILVSASSSGLSYVIL